jgi:hypothetical protein
LFYDQNPLKVVPFGSDPFYVLFAQDALLLFQLAKVGVNATSEVTVLGIEMLPAIEGQHFLCEKSG